MRRRPDAAVEPDTTPGVRVLSAHSGSDFEGQLTNRKAGEVLPGAEPTDSRDPADVTAALRGLGRAHPSGAMST
eukprot:3097522-Prymnesium_polylepis.1